MSSEKDDELLMNLGYRPELTRNFSPFQVFAIAFSIMSLGPSISAVLGLSVAGGGVGMTWGWFVPAIFIMSVGISLAELGSAMPTSGGLYWWTFRFAPPKLKRPLSFLCGYANTLGLIAGICSIDYTFAQMLLSIPALATDGQFIPTKYECYGIFVGAVALQALVAMVPTRLISRLQVLTVAANMVAVGLICIGIPVGIKSRGGHLNSAKFVFGDTTNLSDWSYGWQFLLSWMTAIWTIGAFDSCIHMSEEANNAPVAVPAGIILSIGACWVLGFVILCVVAAGIDQDLARVANTATGNVMAQVLLDSINKGWAIGIMCWLCIVQWMLGLSVIVATSRQTWAFSRDGALPLSRWVRQINLNYGVPVRAVIFDCVVVVVLGLLVLIDTAAANALFSLYSSSNSLSWLLPIAMRLFWYRVDEFKPGPFFLGYTLSRLNNLISVVYLTFVVFILTQLPSSTAVTPSTMNYTCVINSAVWFGCLIYYFVDARKWFNGPKLTLTGETIILTSANELSDQTSGGEKAAQMASQHSTVKDLDIT